MFISIINWIKFQIRLFKIKLKIKKMVSEIKDPSKFKVSIVQNCYGEFYKIYVDLYPEAHLSCWMHGSCYFTIIKTKTTYQINSEKLFNFVYSCHEKLNNNEAFNSISELEKFFRNRNI